MEGGWLGDNRGLAETGEEHCCGAIMGFLLKEEVGNGSKR